MKFPRFPLRTVSTAVFLLLVVGGIIFLANSRAWNIPRALDMVESAGPLAFFSAQALLPVVGVAITPFLLVSGATFGTGFSIVATGITQAISLALTYWIATCWLGRLLARWFPQQKSRFANITIHKRRPILTAFVISATPGPSSCLKSYAMALGGLRLKHYFFVAWPVMMAFDTMTILFGEHMLQGKWFWGAVFLGGLIALGFLLKKLRRLPAMPPPEQNAGPTKPNARNESPRRHRLLSSSRSGRF